VRRVTLFLGCDPGVFARWLENYTGDISYVGFPTGSGYLAVEPARVTQGPSHAPGRLDMEAFHIVVPSGEDEIGQAAYLGSVVSFEVVPLAPERIEVTGECQHPTLQDYFGSLVDEVRRRWPDAPASAHAAEISGDWEAMPGKLAPDTDERWLRLGGEQVDAARMKKVHDALSRRREPETVELVLNAALGAFVNWLEFHASRLQFRPFSFTEGGLCMYLQPPRVLTPERPSHLAPGLTMLLIGGILPEDKATVPEKPWRWSWMLTHEEAHAFEILCGAKPLPFPLGIEFTIAALDADRIEVSGRCDFAVLSDGFHELLQSVRERWPEAKAIPLGEPLTARRGRGPTANTQNRAQHFRRLKHENPNWSYARIAIEASRPVEEGGLGETVTADTVRNAYRAMGWKWERADRVRP
jgi:hypothetical protein